MKAENAGLRKDSGLQCDTCSSLCVVGSGMLRKKMGVVVNIIKPFVVSKMLLEIKDYLISCAAFQNALLHTILH